jgi:hypothetical protein
MDSCWPINSWPVPRASTVSNEDFEEWFVDYFIFISRPLDSMFAHGLSLDSDAFKDGMLNIDYGAIEAYNTALESSDQFGIEQMSMNNQRFDVSKAIFKQIDTNQAGSITQEEFRQWAQGNNQRNFNEQAYGHAPTNNYMEIADGNAHQNPLFAGATPDIAMILQQSGLGRVSGHF